MRRVPIKLHRGQRGAAVPVVIAAVVIVVLIAVAAWFLIIRPSLADKVAVQTAQTSAAASTVSTPPPADVSTMGVDQLLDEAKKAMNDKRFIAPAGNNAFEYYLKVLEKNPGNLVAQDALRETFPFGASAAEQDINANSFDEAQREIELLAKADPGNYTLTILRSKLDAQRTLAARAEEQQKRAEALAAQQEANAASELQPQPQQATTIATPPQQAVASQPAPPPQNTQPAQAATPTPPPAPAGPTRGARLVKSTRPTYPATALRRRMEGWVDVQFTVAADGSVTNVHAVGSNRGRVFERAAVDAVEQWQFEPALENGTPVAKVLVQRIEFKL